MQMEFWDRCVGSRFLKIELYWIAHVFVVRMLARGEGELSVCNFFSLIDSSKQKF